MVLLASLQSFLEKGLIEMTMHALCCLTNAKSGMGGGY